MHSLTRFQGETQKFRATYFKTQLPVLFPQSFFLESIPASRKWFLPTSRAEQQELNYDYLTQFSSTNVPIEITRESKAGGIQFDRIDGPLQLFLEWSRDAVPGTEYSESTRLYIAQCSIADLPNALQADLPTPEVVRQAGKGDVYASSIWMGVPPTYTPLHRDPNPNLFVQLAGTKTVRVLTPNAGAGTFRMVQEKIADETGSPSSSSRMRGEEMMSGREREFLETVVWRDALKYTLPSTAFEATLGPGDGLFIPRGWWHSFKGVGAGINGSVNWWFR